MGPGGRTAVNAGPMPLHAECPAPYMATMAEGEILVFDRRAVRQHRERAARLGTAEFLFEEAADRLAEGLAGAKGGFGRVVGLWIRGGGLGREVRSRPGGRPVGGVYEAIGFVRSGGPGP